MDETISVKWDYSWRTPDSGDPKEGDWEGSGLWCTVGLSSIPCINEDLVSTYTVRNCSICILSWTTQTLPHSCSVGSMYCNMYVLTLALDKLTVFMKISIASTKHTSIFLPLLCIPRMTCLCWVPTSNFTLCLVQAGDLVRGACEESELISALKNAGLATDQERLDEYADRFLEHIEHIQEVSEGRDYLIE